MYCFSQDSHHETKWFGKPNRSDSPFMTHKVQYCIFQLVSKSQAQAGNQPTWLLRMNGKGEIDEPRLRFSHWELFWTVQALHHSGKWLQDNMFCQPKHNIKTGKETSTLYLGWDVGFLNCQATVSCSMLVMEKLNALWWLPKGNAKTFPFFFFFFHAAPCIIL